MDRNKKRSTLTHRGELVNDKDEADMKETRKTYRENPMKTAPNKYTSKDIMNNPTPD